MLWQRIWPKRPSVFGEPEHYLPNSKWCWIIKCNFKLQGDWNKQYNKFLLTGVYEAISLDQQVTVFNHTIFFCISMCHHELYWPDLRKLLRINKCVQHFSNALMSTFVLLWVGHFHVFLIEPSWEFHGLFHHPWNTC